MKYRKKPVVIEAYQWYPDLNISMSTEERSYSSFYKEVYKDVKSSTGFFIDTLEGKHEVTAGDWIITGVKGEKYPCKPDIFEMTYEKVNLKIKYKQYGKTL